jgi:thiol-disulfide isomerase/thioredoxin
VAERRRLDYRVVAAVVFLLGAVAFAAAQLSSLKDQVLDPASAVNRGQDTPAPDFEGIDTWINSEPLTIESLRGTVVLVDFWTYSCVNCIRTLPFLKAFDERYASAGLRIVGVHSPEFEFEKDPDNVRAAVTENGVTWPVAMDNDMATWSAYENQYWPHVYLIDREGSIRADYVGEGQDEAMETRLRELLAKPGLALPPPTDVPAPDLSGQGTPEIYLGYERGAPSGTIANPEGYHPDVPFEYARPSPSQVEDAGPGGFVLASGSWTVGAEAMRADEAGASILLPFSARDVYVVAGIPVTGARILLDGKPIEASQAGADVRAGMVGSGHRDLYHLAHLDEPGFHVLELIAGGAGFEAFTFTFG